MRTQQRKQRADSWYASIPDADMWKAYDACKGMRPWERAAAWLTSTHQVRVSRAGYYRWLDWCRANELQHKLHDARAFAEDTKRIIAEVGDVDATLQEGVAALALDAASTHDVAALGDLVAGLGKLRKDELDRVKAENRLLKARLAELEKTIADRPAPAAQLSPEEKDRSYRSIFGMS